MKEEMMGKMEKYRDVLHKLTADRDNFLNVMEAFRKRDPAEIRKALDVAHIPQEHCVVLCRLECTIHEIMDQVTGEVEKYIECAKTCHTLCKPGGDPLGPRKE